MDPPRAVEAQGEAVFLGRLQELLAAEVTGLDASAKAEVLRHAADILERTGEAIRCRIVPFVPGRRPAAEAMHPGLGSSKLPETYQRPAAEIETLLADVAVLAVLEPDERRALARAARPLTLGPTERLVVKGQEGGSLFVLADGEVEVLLRRGDGEDVLVDTMGKGAVVGEMSLLTGEPRTATVRALDGAVVYEIGTSEYAPILRGIRSWWTCWRSSWWIA